jgi:hypothetical protein
VAARKQTLTTVSFVSSASFESRVAPYVFP